MIDSVGDGLSIGLLISAFFFGLRHGIDWDHIAAITDIVATQEDSRRGWRLGTVYVLGHAVVVFALGVLVILVGEALPDWIDAAMGRVVGWTLLALGVYVIVSLIREGSEFRMRSRWMLVFAGARRIRRFVASRLGGRTKEVVHTHSHAAVDDVHHPGSDPNGAVDDRSPVTGPTHEHPHSHAIEEADYGVGAVALIGALHGIGAETPTQIVIFLAAAQAGGVATGIAVLVAFIVGLVVSNSAITLTSTLSFGASATSRRLHLGLGVATAVLSIVIGTLFVFGADASLPLFFAG
jgi:high-affinity nickel-transport protein